MSPAWIRARVVKVSTRNPRGRTFQVLYRRGGRDFPILSAGTFKTDRDARKRRDLVAGWLAQGIDPRAELSKLAAPSTQKTPERWADEWFTSRHDLKPKSLNVYRNGIDAVLHRLNVTSLDQVTVQACERVVGELVAGYSTATVHNYWQAFSQLLDYAGVEPNPARHRRIRLPKLKSAPPMPPTGPHLAAMFERISKSYVLPMAFIEQTAVRVETIELATWEGLDIAGGRVRVLEKGDKYRWIPVPRWLIRQIESTCPPEDRSSDRRLFPRARADGLRKAMAAACIAGGIPHYHPHDLRHRRASLWHLQGIPDAVLAQRVGHEKSSFTKDKYVHVIPVDEIPDERLEAIVTEALTV